MIDIVVVSIVPYVALELRLGFFLVVVRSGIWKVVELLVTIFIGLAACLSLILVLFDVSFATT